MIEIIPYQDRWPAEFEELRAELLAIIGQYAFTIDHIGSTSVPGLASKDVLDVMLTVSNLTEVELFRSALESARFVFRPHIIADHPPAGRPITPGDWDKRLFNRYEPDRRVHLHVRAAGKANRRYALLFRDYLCANPPAAAAYEGVKCQLAKYHGGTDDHTAYVEIKDPVCDLIMVAAEDWAARAGWRG